MLEQGKKAASSAGWIATGKDLVAMLRDALLLVMAILLIGWPRAINSILVDAGFEEGSFAGLKWKAKLTQSDDALLKAQSAIADLKDQNAKLSQTLAEAKPQIGSAEIKTNIAKLDQINKQLDASSAIIQAAVAITISANSPLLQKVETSTGKPTTWGVVYGADVSATCFL